MALKQAIIVNSDLGMGKGKIAAQAAHAEVYYMEMIMQELVDKIQRRKYDEAKLERYDTWCKDDDAPMKKVVLKATEKEMREFTWKLRYKVWAYPVLDAGKTQIPAGSFTCFIIEPLPEEQCDALFGHLKLL